METQEQVDQVKESQEAITKEEILEADEQTNISEIAELLRTTAEPYPGFVKGLRYQLGTNLQGVVEKICELIGRDEEQDEEPDPYLELIENIFKNMTGRERLLINLFDAAMLGLNECVPAGYRTPREWYWDLIKDIPRAESTPENEFIRGVIAAFEVAAENS